MDSIELGQATEAEVISAIESNMFGHISYFARHLSAMEVLDTPEMLLINSGLRSDTFNFVSRVNFSASEVDSQIDFALNYFQKRNLPVAWWIGANSQPPNLTEYLEKRGIKQVEEATGMAINLSDLERNYPLPGDLEICRVKNIEELEDYAKIIASCWNPPDLCVVEFYRQAAAVAFRPDSPIQFYLGYLENQAIATTELFLDAGVAGLYGVVTLEKHRQRGIGTAMTLAALLDAKKQGYNTATLQASEDGKNIYLRIGFRQYCDFYVYQ